MCLQVAVVRSVPGFFLIAAVALVAAGCAATEECASADAGPPDAGQAECDGDEVARAADDALEPEHVIDHVDDMLP